MVCDNCRGSCELTHIDEDYIAHGKCKNCYSGYSKCQLNVDSIYRDLANLRAKQTDEQFRLLLRKGVYLYEYIPPKEPFYSYLNMSNISDKDYSHAQKVWKGFNMKKVGEYHDLYLKTDILLPSNVVKAFRSTYLKHYGLDLAHFHMSPGLAWQVCLKKMGIWLELLTNYDMLEMFERGIRDGVTQAVHRYAKANNKYMGDKFNPKKRAATYSIWMQAIYMVGRGVNCFQLEDSIGLIRVNLRLIILISM